MIVFFGVVVGNVEYGCVPERKHHTCLYSRTRSCWPTEYLNLGSLLPVFLLSSSSSSSVVEKSSVQTGRQKLLLIRVVVESDLTLLIKHDNY